MGETIPRKITGGLPLRHESPWNSPVTVHRPDSTVTPWTNIPKIPMAAPRCQMESPHQNRWEVQIWGS